MVKNRFHTDTNSHRIAALPSCHKWLCHIDKQRDKKKQQPQNQNRQNGRARRGPTTSSAGRRTVGLPHLIRLHLHSVPETVAAWPPSAPWGGVREQRRPLLLQITVRTLPSSWELGSDPVQGTARAQAATGGPPTQLHIPGERSGRGRGGRSRFKTFPYSATFAPGVEDTAALSWLDHRGQTSTEAWHATHCSRTSRRAYSRWE